MVKTMSLLNDLTGSIGLALHQFLQFIYQLLRLIRCESICPISTFAQKNQEGGKSRV
jgi:hypothetical protein